MGQAALRRNDLGSYRTDLGRKRMCLADGTSEQIDVLPRTRRLLAKRSSRAAEIACPSIRMSLHRGH